MNDYYMKKKFGILLTIGILVVGLIAITVLAAPPNKCNPWPECKNGGEDPPPQPSECPDTNTRTSTPSLVLSTPNSLKIYQWDDNDYVEVASLNVNLVHIKSLIIGDVMLCHPGPEIIISGDSYSGKARKKTNPYVKVFAYDGTTITEIESITPGINPWGMATGRLYPSDVDQLLVDSAASSGEGLQRAELYEHDGSGFVKVHDFVKDPPAGNFWTFIGDLTGSGIPVAGIPMGNTGTPKRGFWLWENQAGSWVNVNNIWAGEFVHDDGELVDVDNDSILDLITTGSNGDLVVVKGGTYDILLNYDISAYPTQSLAVGDFNGDDCQDITVATSGGSDIENYTAAVFEGDCLGNFTRVQNLNSQFDANSIYIQIMESRDLNKNGYDEIFLYEYDWNSGDSVLVIWEHNGSDYNLVDSKTVASGEGTYTMFGSAMLP